MNFIQAVILGIVEGVTEFLPISSTFHLIYAAKLLGVAQNDFAKLFEVFIQSGAILSVVFLYAKDLVNDRELVKKTMASFFPTAIVGLALYKIIKNVFFESDRLMIGVFIGMGVAFIGYELFLKQRGNLLRKTAGSLTYTDAVLVGFIQSLAVVPGVSRSGAVILGMMLLRYERAEAARYSFILSIPTIFAASFLDLFKMRDVVFQYSENLMLLASGFAAAFVSSYIVVQWFIGYLKSNSLSLFGYYRLLLAAGLMFFLSRY